MELRHLTAALFALGSLTAAAQTDTTAILIETAKPACQADNRMYGIFFEDINFGADGGLYAEMVKNRSFEFPQPLTGWTAFGQVSIESSAPCFERNPHYVHIACNGQLTGSGLDNEGFRGIGLKQGSDYRFTTYARSRNSKGAEIDVELVGSDGATLCKEKLSVSSTDWKKYTLRLTSPLTEAKAKLRIVMRRAGEADLDHISLFPTDTWKGREGGLRRDLVEALRDLHPGVMRFPGGCVVEGNSLATRYQWKNSVGSVENRPLNENRWNYTFKHRAFPDYYQSYGLGFYEFFQLCEDIGARPLPILSVGLSCQYESNEIVPLDSLQPYIDDALDLIEFANGDATTTWGRLRAQMGHPEAFGLQMIGIGNEQWGNVYTERLERFVKAIRDKHPEVKIVGSAGPSADGDKFNYLWPEMKRLKADLVDEHYYMAPEWFLNNAARYDSYDRKGPKVFAGEYAAHDYSTQKANNWRSAIAEAAFMTGLERNADVVRLATYAPLFAHVDAWQWNPDLIWYDNLRCMRTPNYYVQQLYALHTPSAVFRTTSNGAALTGQRGLYATAGRTNADGRIILKLVNTADTAQIVRVTLSGLRAKELQGICTYLQSDNLDTVNSFEAERIAPHAMPVSSESDGTLLLQLPRHFFGVYEVSATK